MKGNIESLLELLVTVAQLLTFLVRAVRWLANQKPLSKIGQLPSKLFRFASKHWAVLSAVVAWGSTIVSGYLSQKPINILVVVMLACLIIPPTIHGARIWRRNPENIVEELAKHLAKTFAGYLILIVVPCIIILILNPSAENILSVLMLPHHLIALASPLLAWAVMAGVVSPLVWEYARRNMEEVYVNASIKRLRKS